MIKEIQTYNDVLIYSILGNRLFISRRISDGLGELEIIELNSWNVLSKTTLPEPIMDIFDFQEELYCLGYKSNQIFLLSKDYKCITPVAHELKCFPVEMIDGQIVFYEGRIKNKKWGIYSFSNNSKVWSQSDFKALFLTSNYVFGQNNWVLAKLSFGDGQIQWTKDLKSTYSKLTKIKGRISFLGLHKNILIISIEDIDLIIGIDSSSGEILWEHKSIVRFYRYNEECGILEAFTRDYVSVSADNGTILFKSTVGNEDFTSQRTNYYVSKNRVLTTDWKKSKIGHYIKSEDKLEIYDIDGDYWFPSPQKMMYSNNLLFLKDNENELRIYQLLHTTINIRNAGR